MKSTTQTIPEHTNLPRHIAIILDGNGRWAKKRFMPRVFGHKKGVDRLFEMIDYCHQIGIRNLTVFAFSTENWRRPQKERTFLMDLFKKMLQEKVRMMHQKNYRLKVIGYRHRIPVEVCELMEEAEKLTANNTGITFTIALDYGGRQDLLQAFNQLLQTGVKEVTEDNLREYIALGNEPEVDLMIRTGGESRISNFLLWQLAYSEFYFTDTLWPDFTDKHLDQAIQSFQLRERRFGRTSEQLPPEEQRPD